MAASAPRLKGRSNETSSSIGYLCWSSIPTRERSASLDELSPTPLVAASPVPRRRRGRMIASRGANQLHERTTTQLDAIYAPQDCPRDYIRRPDCWPGGALAAIIARNLCGTARRQAVRHRQARPVDDLAHHRLARSAALVPHRARLPETPLQQSTAARPGAGA